MMISIDKAMSVASELFNGAKTIITIRDGLEVMRQGIDNETQDLKRRRGEGIPVALIQNSQQSEQETQLIQQ